MNKEGKTNKETLLKIILVVIILVLGLQVLIIYQIYQNKVVDDVYIDDISYTQRSDSFSYNQPYYLFDINIIITNGDTEKANAYVKCHFYLNDHIGTKSNSTHLFLTESQLMYFLFGVPVDNYDNASNCYIEIQVFVNGEITDTEILNLK